MITNIDYDVGTRVHELKLRAEFDDIYDDFRQDQDLYAMSQLFKLQACDRVVFVDYIHQTLNQPELAFAMARRLINPIY